MADKKITELPAGGLPQDTDDFVVARGVTNNKLAWSSLSAAAVSHQIKIVASDATYTSGSVVLTGLGGGVTVGSNAGQVVEISVAAPVAQSVQTQNLHNVTLSGNTSGVMAEISSGTMSLAGGNNITLSQAGNAVTISAAAQSVQPETQTFIAGISASDTLYTSGNVRFTGSQAVTVRSGAAQLVVIDAPAQTVQTQNLHNVTLSGNTAGVMAEISSGTMSLAGGNNITLSQAGNAVTISAAAQSVQPETQTFIAGISASDTLYTSGNVRFTGVGGGVTVSSNTGQRVDISVAAPVAQSLQTQGILSAGVSTGGNTQGNTQVSTGSQFVLVGTNNITLSQATAAGATTVSISGVASQTVQTQNMVAVSASNTLYSSGTVVFTGSNMITVKSSGAGQTIILDATQSVQTQSFLSAGMSTGGNTSGDTGYVTGRLNFAGGNNITLSGSTNAGSMTITISAPNLGAGAMSAGVSNLGNTAGSTGVTGTRLVLVGTNQVSLSQSTDANGGTVTIDVPQKTAAAWENMPVLAAVRVTHLSGVSKTPFYWYENLPQGIKPANIAFRVSMVTAGSDLSLSAHFGVYTFVNSTSAALLGSGSNAFVVSSASSVSFSGQRELILTSPGTVAAISSLTPGGYLFGMMFSASATNAMNASIYAASDAAGRGLGGIRPGTNQLSTATNQGVAGFYGYGSTTVNVMPANVVTSDITNLGSGASSPLRPYIFIRS